MYSLNRAQVIGNLTRDPELKVTPNGQNVASFAVATNRSWNNPDGTRQDSVEYHDIVAWGKLAEIANQVLAKGKPAYVEGRLQTRNWDAQDGSKRSKTEIVAENIIALGTKDGASARSFERNSDSSETTQPAEGEKPTKKPSTAKDTTEEINIDDIPF